MCGTKDYDFFFLLFSQNRRGFNGSPLHRSVRVRHAGFRHYLVFFRLH